MTSTVKVIGFPEMAKRMRKMAAESDRAINRALRSASIDVVRIAKVTAPKRTGALRRSIRVARDPISRRPSVAAGGGGTGVNYAAYVEFGHTTIGGGMVSPRPYLIPAARWVLPTIPERIARELKKVMG